MERNFDIADFEANPSKYEMFRTAQIAVDYDVFKRGEYVTIEWLYNADEPVLQNAIVPVYRVRHGDTESHLYANAFMNMVL